MKGNKKLLVVAVLLLLITVSFTTYAIYKSTATADGSISTAAWVVSVNNTDITENNTFTLGNITWATPTVGKNNKIAPGDHGTVTITIDADGSEVDVDYIVTVDTSALSNFTVGVASGSDPLTGTISYDATEGNMEKTVTLDITWEAIDGTAENTNDIGISGQDFSLPVTVTAVQNPNLAPSPSPVATGD